MARIARIYTWDRGRRPLDMDGEGELLGPILETVLEGGLWEELAKFPADTVIRVLPRVTIPRNIRRLAEIWVEEHVARPRARRVATPRARRGSR